MRTRRLTLLVSVVVIVAMFPGQALADPPDSGTVFEGASVPGAAIGDTRAEVEASYGEPSFCQSITAGDFAACQYNTGEGSVSVRYVGADGGDAQASPGDQVHGFNWSGHEGWVTTAGISTASTPEEAVAAYPDAEHVVGSFGFESVTDYDLGIRWTKSVNPYFGTVRIFMSIFPSVDVDPDPDDPPDDPDPNPEPGPTISIDAIEFRVRGNFILAQVYVVDDGGSTVDGAEVFATWTLPDGSTVEVSQTTSRRGQARFSIGHDSGTFTLTVDDVVFEGHEFAGGDVSGTVEG